MMPEVWEAITLTFILALVAIQPPVLLIAAAQLESQNELVRPARHTFDLAEGIIIRITDIHISPPYPHASDQSSITSVAIKFPPVR